MMGPLQQEFHFLSTLALNVYADQTGKERQRVLLLLESWRREKFPCQTLEQTDALATVLELAVQITRGAFLLDRKDKSDSDS